MHVKGCALILTSFRSDLYPGWTSFPTALQAERTGVPLPTSSPVWTPLTAGTAQARRCSVSCSVHREGKGWAILTRSCREAVPQKPAQENCSFSNNHLHRISKGDSEVRRQHKQVLSQASKCLTAAPDGWLWAPSTASLYSQSMCMVSLLHQFWCLNKGWSYTVIFPLNKELVLPLSPFYLPSFMKLVET